MWSTRCPPPCRWRGCCRPATRPGTGSPYGRWRTRGGPCGGCTRCRGRPDPGIRDSGSPRRTRAYGGWWTGSPDRPTRARVRTREPVSREGASRTAPGCAPWPTTGSAPGCGPGWPNGPPPPRNHPAGEERSCCTVRPAPAGWSPPLPVTTRSCSPARRSPAATRRSTWAGSSANCTSCAPPPRAVSAPPARARPWTTRPPPAPCSPATSVRRPSSRREAARPPLHGGRRGGAPAGHRPRRHPPARRPHAGLRVLRRLARGPAPVRRPARRGPRRGGRPHPAVVRRPARACRHAPAALRPRRRWPAPPPAPPACPVHPAPPRP